MKMGELTARLDRLPPAPFHRRVLWIMGLGWAFDGMDTGIIAFIVAAVAASWHLVPQTVGLILSSGLAGAFIGSAVLPALSDRWGRKAVFQWSLIGFSVFSLICALAWSAGSLVFFRTLVGIGLGAETPIISSYIGELMPSNRRGWMVGVLNAYWGLGWVVASVVSYFVIPAAGWRWAFVVGALPALLVAFSRRSVPESPRWLLLQGRESEADAVVHRIEETVARELGAELAAVVPDPAVADRKPQPAAQALFGRGGVQRTLMLWLWWFCLFSGYYGLFSWVPSLLVKSGLSLTRSFGYVFFMQLAYVPNQLLGAHLADRVGRKPILFVNSILAAVCGLLYGLVIVGHGGAAAVITMGVLTSFFVSGAFGGSYAYTAEQYPTEARATGFGVAVGVGRIGSVLTPAVIGMVLPSAGAMGAFWIFSAAFVVAALNLSLLGRETRGASLEALTAAD